MAAILKATRKMKIDLESIKTYWINMSSQAEKHSRMLSMFGDLGMKNTEHFEGVVLEKDSTIIDGSGMATHTLLTKAMKNGEYPFLVLEDDAKFTEYFKKVYDVPPECDALYLGVSKAGARGCRTVATRYNKDYLRVWNMLATHAVIYFNEKYIRRLLHRGFVYLNARIPYDIAIAEIHDEFCVLTPNEPAFYQYDPQKTSKYDVEYFTKDPLIPVESTERIVFHADSKVLNA